MTGPPHVLAIDQGTSSTRAMIFDPAGAPVAIDQREHAQLLPRPGWVEHDPVEILANVAATAAGALSKAGLSAADIAGVGITNQRETTVVWDRRTGVPVAPAIVWQDTRTSQLVAELAAHGGRDRYASRVGLPLAAYFSGPKVTWLLDSDPDLRSRAEAGDLLMGTIDSWLIWHLTGGPAGGVHVTDVTNASRTLLMDLRRLEWDAGIAADLRLPTSMLPRIQPSVSDFGTITVGPLAGVPITAVLGDQQAAIFGQACFEPGMVKNTYGTGNFMLMNTGSAPVASRHGLITTVAYQLQGRPPVYALEGSIAVTGSLVQWLRDNLGLISEASAIEPLAASVPDNGGVYVVPAFSGLFAPYWRPDARGVIAGLTRFANRAHLARAALEASAYQTKDVAEAMMADSGVRLSELRVDGGMTHNALLMQFQADLLGVDVMRPVVAETTALGAAQAAGIGVGLWASTEEVAANWAVGARWRPAMGAGDAERLYRCWGKAVYRTLDWVED